MSATPALGSRQKSDDEALRQRIDVHAQLDLVQSLLDRHPLPEDTQKRLAKSCTKVRQRWSDPKLYLAVVGEFSSGKSTLINALIRQHLLRSSVVQATTAAPTLLTYGERPEIEYETIDGRHVEVAVERPATLDPSVGDDALPGGFRAQLLRLTTDEEVALGIALVTVRIPSPVLENGLVIVDTPGCNVDNKRHVEVAGWAMREVCDAALILIPATVPVSMTLANFAVANLGPYLHRCLFVVTMIDQVAPAKRPELMRSIRDRLRAMLGIDEPVVLAASAALLLEEPEEPQNANEAADQRWLLETFDATEHTIARTLSAQRAIIVLERLSRLLSALFDDMYNSLHELEKVYSKDHQILKKHQTVNLREFAAAAKEHHRKALKRSRDELLSAAQHAVRKSRDRARKGLKQAFDRAADEETLRRMLETEAPTIIERIVGEISDEAKSLLRRQRKRTRSELKSFEAGFVEHYRDLAKLGNSKVIERKVLSKDLKAALERLPQSLSALKKLASSDQEDDGKRALSGAGSGALIGTALLPGVGTVLGAAIGFLASSWFGPPFEERRRRYWKELDDNLGSSFATAQEQLAKTLSKGHASSTDILDSTIDRYVELYAKLIQQRTAEGEDRLRELQTKRQRVRQDCNAIEGQQRHLKTQLDELETIRPT